MKKLLVIFLSLIVSSVHAQMPSNIPVDNEPVRFFESAGNILFYILIPLIILVLYWVWRKKTNKKNN